MIEFKEITNSKKQNAVIIQVNSESYNQAKYKLEYSKITSFKNYRIYFWIDNVEDSLNEEYVLNKFKVFFDDDKLGCSLRNSGKPFDIGYPKNREKIKGVIFSPRKGQDGGVVGVDCP
ncbi:hypothetical protein [Olleya sp. R77988]|uniref:hypothetical protein n=1 Tax=Olleya sp. R77988 TaxID=3093875 RepID=UPI0037C68586